MSELDVPSDAKPNDSYVTIPDVPIQAETNITNPNQIRSGVTRGIQQLGSDKVYSDGGNNQIIVADTTPRVLMGNQTTFGEGFYVSKSGVNATTNTDPSQWIFNSNQNVFKIIISGVDTVTVTGIGEKRKSIPHNLGFKPIVTGFIQNPSGDIQSNSGAIQCPFGIYGDTVTGGSPSILLPLLQYYYVGADSTNIYLVVLSSDTAFYSQLLGTFTFRYYVLQETAGTS